MIREADGEELGADETAADEVAEATETQGAVEGEEATGQEQQAPEDGEAAEGAEGSEGSGKQEQEDHEEGEQKPIKGLPPEVQQTVDRRIGKLTAKRKAAEEAAATLKAELAGTQERLKALEDGKDAALAAEAAKLGIHPEYVSADEVQVLKQYDALQADEAWLLDHLESGYEGGNGQRSLTAEQVRRELARTGQQLRALAPRAEGLKQAKTAEMIRHMRLGREAERAGWKPGQKPSGSAAPAGAGKPAGQQQAGGGRPAAAPRPAAIPGQGRSGSAAPRPSAQPGRGSTFSLKALHDAGGGKQGLVSLYGG